MLPKEFRVERRAIVSYSLLFEIVGFRVSTFRVDEQTNRLSFEYDASRLKESEVAHVLRMARIPVQRRV